jgi:hypothetical protein
MRLTTEQRIAALERDNVVLHDTVKLLHKLLREQRQLINDYITQKVALVSGNEGRNENKRPEDALYTFVCRRRFEDLEKHMGRIRKLVENPNIELKAI